MNELLGILWIVFLIGCLFLGGWIRKMMSASEQRTRKRNIERNMEQQILDREYERLAALNILRKSGRFE